MKLYIISGLGADYKVLERIVFPANIEVVFIQWLIPIVGEDFYDYVKRMADKVDDAEPFCILGYSFGGIVAQEINKLKKAQKIILLGSIKSHAEKSRWIRAGKYTKVPKLIPVSFFNETNFQRYSVVRKWIDPKNPKILNFFNVRDPYYLKWSIEKIADWDAKQIEEDDTEVVQIMGDKDIVFPIQNSKPDFVIKNGTHLFPSTKHREVSEILKEILK